MGVLSSQQVSARPLRLRLNTGLEQLRSAMIRAVFDPTSSAPSTGWGGVYDTDFALGFRPGPAFQVGQATIVEANEHLPRRLRSRYYWMHASSARKKQQPGSDTSDWRTRHILRAADVLAYEEQDGSLTVLITARDNGSFNIVVEALRTVALSAADRVEITSDIISEQISGDLFLWLVYLLQDRQEITANLHLSSITELSSKDRNLRPAKFSESATLERVELAALIALGKVSFGPAKFTLDVAELALGLDLQLYPDGGFQPFRSSLYDEEEHEFTGTEQALTLFDDVWIRVLPELREAHRVDERWDGGGRMTLRNEALEQVRVLLRLAAE